MDLGMLKRIFELLGDQLNERDTRLLAGAAAMDLAHGGISSVAKATQLTRPTIYAGIKEVKEIEARKEQANQENQKKKKEKKRQRRPGGGRKELQVADNSLLKSLENLVQPYTRGDPESPLRWTSKSFRRLSKELAEEGFVVSHMSVGRLLLRLGYTIQSNRKSHEGGNSPDRDAQFQLIANSTASFLNEGYPIISVDAKKKELIGNFKNNGREWLPMGQPEKVNVYDFVGDEGRATPYGIYDIADNTGYVNVGISHDTAKFAVRSIENWWENMGAKNYPDCKAILITADGGGSNGSRNRLWKKELQRFANENNLAVYVSHFPPGTSKWNKIEHRMFSVISMNWRGKPLTSLEVIVNLIGNTTTEKGLKITCGEDKNVYDLGEKVSDEAMTNLDVRYNKFHPEWNYAIFPQEL